MALPGLDITTVDGRLGLAGQSSDKPLVIGPSSKGTEDTIYTFGRPKKVTDSLGHGQGVSCAAHILDVSGGSVDVLKCGASTAATNSSVTQSGGGPTVSVSGDGYDFYDVIVTVVAGGALGTGTFKYSLDGGQNEGGTRTIPSGGSFEIPNTNLTLTFASGTYIAAETYSFTATPATFNASDLNDAIDALLAVNNRYKFVVFAGMAADASTAASLATAIDGHMVSLANDFRYLRAYVDCGDDTSSNVNTEFESVEDLRLDCNYGKARIFVSNPIEGWVEPELPYLYLAASRTADFTRGTNIGWVGGGSFKKAGTTVSFDEAKEGESLHNKKINTVRTYVGRGGFYPTNGLLKSPAGSDFRYAHWGLAFDLLCQTVHDALQPFINSSVRTLKDGTGAIHPKDKARIDKAVNQAIRNAVLSPLDDQGFAGYFTAAEFKVDPNHNVLGTNTLRGDVSAIPKAVTERIELTAGLASSLSTGEESSDE